MYADGIGKMARAIIPNSFTFQLDFQFLDLQDLGDSDKNQLMAILKSNNVTDALKLPWDTVDNNHETNSTVTEISELQNHWYQNGNDNRNESKYFIFGE